jgi:hypothetical protein
MQQSVDVACATLSLPSFQVSPAHAMAFKNLQFAGGQYFDIGTGLLPFSITPADAQSSAARVMLTVDQGRADAFDLGADPETSAIAPGDVPRLRNLVCKFFCTLIMYKSNNVHIWIMLCMIMSSAHCVMYIIATLL